MLLEVASDKHLPTLPTKLLTRHLQQETRLSSAYTRDSGTLSLLSNSQDIESNYHHSSQNIVKTSWNRFYISYLHTTEMLSHKRHKPLNSTQERPLWPLHFEKCHKNNKWPLPHRISNDCKLTYLWKTNDLFSWV